MTLVDTKVEVKYKDGGVWDRRISYIPLITGDGFNLCDILLIVRERYGYSA
jgi:hypothetical protein